MHKIPIPKTDDKQTKFYQIDSKNLQGVATLKTGKGITLKRLLFPITPVLCKQKMSIFQNAVN